MYTDSAAKNFAAPGLTQTTGSKPKSSLAKLPEGGHNTLCSQKLTACVVLALSAFIGCGYLPANGGPPIQFTRIPPVSPGGPSAMGSIAGRVHGSHHALKVVLYARSGKWYVQPYADQPFTEIKPDSTWSSPTHLGSHYAALLVQPDYVPSAVIDNLPGVGGSIAAVGVTEGTPPLWQRSWFRWLAALSVAIAMLAFSRWRMQAMARQLNLRFEERLAERTRIAQELHDTLLQGLVSISMQLHVLADQLPADSRRGESLDHILQLMSKVIDEGRNAIRGMRPSISNSHGLEEILSRLPQELAPPRELDFRIVAEGPSRTLHPIIRDEVYRIAREAITNAFRHSAATSVEVELEYGQSELSVVVRDNGRGIDSALLQEGKEGHFGLSLIRDRAQNIGAKLTLWSSPGAGTEVRLVVPGRVAFESFSSHNFSSWLSRVNLRRSDSGRIKDRKFTPK